MSEARKPHMVAWLFGASAAVVLYMLSWGPIMGRYFSIMDANNAVQAWPSPWRGDTRPAFIRYLYAPVELFAYYTGSSQVFIQYLLWCHNQFYIRPPGSPR